MDNVVNDILKIFKEKLEKNKALLIVDCMLLESSQEYFDILLIQEITRKINNEEKKFLAIRDIAIKDQYQRKGLFKKILINLDEECKKSKINFMLEDVLNKNLKQYLEKQNFNQIKIEHKAHYLPQINQYKKDKYATCFYKIYED